MLVKQTLRKVLSTNRIYLPRYVPCLSTLSHICIALRSSTNVLVNFHHHRYFCDHQHQLRSSVVNNKRTTTFAIKGSFDFTNIVNIRMFSSSVNNKNGGSTIAVCQLTAKSDKEANFAICKNLIESAACAGAKVVFLPEACDYVAESKQDAVDFSEPLDGKLVCDYKDLAKSLQVWLSLGGIHERVEGGKVQNAHLLISDQGEVVSVYRKLHLFDVEIPEKNIRLKESDYVKKGEQIVPPISTPVGEIGLAICYDMRFPELGIVLRNMGAKILTYPSAFTFATGAIHWEVLLRSRAIENQCYVIAAAQTGHHNKKRSSWGHAMVIDPLGSIVAQCSEGTGFALATIDLESINNARKSMPIGEHKRTDVYPEMMMKKLFSAASDDNLASNPSNVNNKYQFGQVVIPHSCVFYKTELTMAFVNKRCVVPGHVLVAPLRPALRLIDLNEQEVTDLFLVVQKVQKVMEQVHGATSTTIAVQDGPEAGRTIKHLHVHILPRRQGDFLQNDEIYYQLQQHDKVDDKPWRSEEEMNKEAAQLIKHFAKSDS